MDGVELLFRVIEQDHFDPYGDLSDHVLTALVDPQQPFAWARLDNLKVVFYAYSEADARAAVEQVGAGFAKEEPGDQRDGPYWTYVLPLTVRAP